MRVIVPQTIQFGFVRRTVCHDEAITQREWFLRSDLDVSRLLRCEIKERFCRVNALRLRGADVVRMAEHGDASEHAIDEPAHVRPTPDGFRFVALAPIGHPLAVQKVEFVFPVPGPVASHANAAIAIPRQLQGPVRTCVRNLHVEQEARLCWTIANGVELHVPSFVQSGLRLFLVLREIHLPMLTDESRMDGAAPRFVERYEFHESFSVAHVPEIRLAALKLGVCPCEPDAVMVLMVARIIVCDLLSTWA